MNSFISFLALTAGCTSVSTAFSSIHYPKLCQQRSTSSSSKTSLSMALTLYGSQGSRSPLVNWAANELDLPLAMGDLSKNPHPFKQIPCLTDDNDVVVFESGAILNHLQVKADEKKDDIDAKKSAAIISWISWANASLDPICFLETPDGKVYDTGLKSPNKRISQLNEIISDSESSYLLPDGFSLADVAVASYLLYVVQFFPDVNLSRWPAIVKYMKDCASREGYGKAFGGNVQQFLLDKLNAQENGKEEKKLFGMF